MLTLSLSVLLFMSFSFKLAQAYTTMPEYRHPFTVTPSLSSLEDLEDRKITVTISSSTAGYSSIQSNLMKKYSDQLRRRDLSQITGNGFTNQSYKISPGSYIVTVCPTPLTCENINISVYEEYFHAGFNPLGSRLIITSSQNILDEFFDEVWNSWNTRKDDTINVYHNNPWAHPKQILKRPLNTVYLPKGLSEDLMSDLKKFGEMQPIYRKFAVPYRRGYLLSGPPGTGKTSVIHALASELDRPLVVISIDGDMDKDDLMSILDRTPAKAFVVIEDVDALYTHRETKKLRITFSDFINVVDGLSSREGIILIMTTNHVENIDPALLRPGRADMHIRLGYATKDQMYAVFKAYIPEQLDSFEEFYEGLPKDLTTATLQRFFFSHLDCNDILEFKSELMVKEPLIVAEADTGVVRIDPENWLNFDKTNTETMKEPCTEDSLSSST